ncbi:MAG: glycosyltransferase family 39 protein [Anaerolineae bacterium]|nr:glycosyltransferase family 39 protein [Anaerolineae bacterium]
MMIRPWLGITIASILLIALRWLFPERPVTYIGPQALLDSGFALGFLGIMLLLAGGLGRKLQNGLKLGDLTSLEYALFGIALGLGVIAYGILLLGLLGLLQPLAVFVWLLLIAIWSWPQWREMADSLPRWLADKSQAWRNAPFWQKMLLVTMSLILILTMLQSLSPPIDPDGLIDHLQAPRIFLQAERIYPTPDFVFGNFPFTIELLFASGMVFGTDTFAKLIHLTFAVLLVLGTFALGRRYLSSNGAWVAAAILVGMPIFPIWAGLAYIDMGWTLYEFLGVYAILLWADRNQQRWVILSGVMIGFALGSKYLAFAGAGAIGLWVLWQARLKGWRTLFGSAALFGGIALVVASPWFIKNWWWFDNPVYPYFFGNKAISGIPTYGSFRWWDYLMLPWYLYFERQRFVGAYGSIEFPSLLFPFILLLPWVGRFKIVPWLAVLTLLRYIFWALIFHGRFRYMLPVLPNLSLLASAAIVGLAAYPIWQRAALILAKGLIGGMLAITLIYSVLFFFDVQPLAVVLGIESKESFLQRELTDYSAQQFIQANLPPQARVFMLWNARSYYCDDRCLPDLNQYQWVQLTQPSATVSEVAARLREKGVTHLMVSIEDVEYRLIQSDGQLHRAALQFFRDEFQPACTRELYQDDWVRLYEFTCR